MWVPSSIEELESLVTLGQLEEVPSLDCKRDLSSNSRDLAKDMAAMSVDGGVLIIGIGEDDKGRPNQLSPIDLKGAAERLDQIAQSAIHEPLKIITRELVLDLSARRGYLVVIVPPSPRAPHMVEVGGENRYYGRGDKVNRKLSEGDVARLYQRRNDWLQDQNAILDRVVSWRPEQTAMSYDHPGQLLFIAQPVLRDQPLFQRVLNPAGTASLEQQHSKLLNIFSEVHSRSHARDLRRPLLKGWDMKRSPAGWQSAIQTHDPSRQIYDIFFSNDGEIRSFYTGFIKSAAEKRVLDVYEMAGVLHEGIELMRRVMLASGYYGPIDVGVVIRGLNETIASDRMYGSPYRPAIPDQYPGDEHRSSCRIFAVGGVVEYAEQLVDQLLEELVIVLCGRTTLSE